MDEHKVLNYSEGSSLCMLWKNVSIQNAFLTRLVLLCLLSLKKKKGLIGCGVFKVEFCVVSRRACLYFSFFLSLSFYFLWNICCFCMSADSGLCVWIWAYRVLALQLSSVCGALIYIYVCIFGLGMNYWRRLEGRACLLVSGMDRLLCPGWR